MLSSIGISQKKSGPELPGKKARKSEWEGRVGKREENVYDPIVGLRVKINRTIQYGGDDGTIGIRATKR